MLSPSTISTPSSRSDWNVIRDVKLGNLISHLADVKRRCGIAVE